MKTALVIVALVVVIYLMAGPATGPGGSTVTGPYDQVPGGGLSGPISPAMAGGQPTNSADNALRLATNITLPGMWGKSLGWDSHDRNQTASDWVGTPPSQEPSGLPTARTLPPANVSDRLAIRLTKI